MMKLLLPLGRAVICHSERSEESRRSTRQRTSNITSYLLTPRFHTLINFDIARGFAIAFIKSLNETLPALTPLLCVILIRCEVR